MAIDGLLPKKFS